MTIEAQIGYTIIVLMVGWFLSPFVLGAIVAPFVWLGKLFKKGG